MAFKRAALIATLLVAASATPLIVRQDASGSASGSGSDDTYELPNYVYDDGTLDITSLYEAAVIVPDNVPPPVITTEIIPIDPAAVMADVVDQAASQTDNSTTSSGSGSISKRATTQITPKWAGYSVCGTQLPTSGPLPAVDTPAGFSSDQNLYNIAMNAKTPAGFSRVFAGQTAVFQTYGTNAYLGNKRLETYNPQICADMCTSGQVKNCQSFDIYFERNPSIDLGKADLSKCNNPPSINRIGCQFFGIPPTLAGATSDGQIRGNYFRTAKAGSNAYTLPIDLKLINGTKPPQVFPNGKIDNQKGHGFLLAVTLFTVNPTPDPTFCYALAARRYGTKWQSFLTWSSLRNGVYVGQGCLIYKKAGYTSADANDGFQHGSSKKGEGDVRYTSAPALYYERDDSAKYKS
ncbi:hypothetical protein OC845_004880 [Tilletia horrida]|nr:hypothetical protein OC845_004880 [Tilletia horrida]